MTRVWETPSGLVGVLTTVDHKEIGKRYVATAFTFFVVGGIQALVMRTQLAQPENRLLDPQTYNQIFSMHGTTMIFLFATPILSGFGNFFVPLMLGARDMAFPRLNAFSYWVFLLSGIFLYSSFVVGQAPNGGWFAYVPLTSSTYSPALNMDFWALGIMFVGLASTVGAINFIVTFFKLRAPGMSLNRVPLFVWNVTVTAFMMVFALPPLTVACALLEMDRKVGTHFYDPMGGGNPLLWQHLFWVFGHPDVYIIFLPAIGMVSNMLPVFSRRPIVGYSYVALATVATAFLGFGVWVHHMFATGLSPLALMFFAVASLMITIPTAVQIFAWIATIWGGRPVFQTPFLFLLGFLFVFVIGGLSGVMFAAVPFDQQVTDTYFVVAHFHYVLIGGAVFPVMGALHYWLPKMTGKLLDETVGRWTFALFFVGFNLTFFPMHVVGLEGMPRRVYTYPPNMGWDTYNLIETVGAFVLAFSVLVFLGNFFRSLSNGEPAGDDPWGGSTLEWATSSPPPPYNFRVLPVVHSRDPLWDEGGVTFEGLERQEARAAAEWRENLGTTLHDARPDEILLMPTETAWPLVLALAVAAIFVGILVELWGLAVVGAVVAAVAIGGWLWPTPEERAAAEAAR